MLTPRPTICIVDDEPDRLRALNDEFAPTADLHITHPEDLRDGDLAGAHLVLVDYILKEWPTRDHQILALQPLNGLGLVAVLRNHVQERLRPNAPTAFAIHSGHLGDLSPGMPPQALPQAIARSQNLEWVFPKNDVSALVLQASSLARAVQALPPDWSLDDIGQNPSVAQKLIDLPTEEAWSLRAWEDVEDAHPPIHELSEWTHGLAFLRWLLHRILPYPCFLRDQQYLAARLHVSVDSLKGALGAKGALWDALQPFLYTGILDDFLGPRWWRAGIEAYLWEATRGRSFDPDAIQRVLGDVHGTPLEQVPYVHPVVCLDGDLLPLPELCDNDRAVLIQPDDWPPYADQALALKKSTQENPRLQGIVFRGNAGAFSEPE